PLFLPQAPRDRRGRVPRVDRADPPGRDRARPRGRRAAAHAALPRREDAAPHRARARRALAYRRGQEQRRDLATALRERGRGREAHHVDLLEARPRAGRARQPPRAGRARPHRRTDPTRAGRAGPEAERNDPMTDTTFPAPPAPPRPPEASAPPPEPQNPATRAGTRALAITISVLGGGALVVGGIGVGLGTAGATIASGLTEATSQAVSVAGATEFVADVGAGRLDIEFGGGDEAVLEATGAEGAWTFERRGEKIVVSAPGRALDLFGWHIDPAATLTLPRSAEGIDL